MAAIPEFQIPVLTEAIDAAIEAAGVPDSADRDALIAELQTEIASRTFTLTDTIMRKAFAEMEASIFEQISGSLRRELPEMVDELLREHLGGDEDD
ncbi:MAG TPA: hypothetical protein VIV64_00730 [Gammaproteobacteria bacterium]|jgi:hypothetical protein